MRLSEIAGVRGPGGPPYRA
ncbi:MAG: hypothetical protein WA268_08300 [Xanthobacteraceae bacterium]